MNVLLASVTSTIRGFSYNPTYYPILSTVVGTSTLPYPSNSPKHSTFFTSSPDSSFCYLSALFYSSLATFIAYFVILLLGYRGELYSSGRGKGKW